ncbi:MAG: ABC transporter permease [Steroidobacteraceae bacterium]
MFCGAGRHDPPTCGQRGLDRQQRCPCIAVAIDTPVGQCQAGPRLQPRILLALIKYVGTTIAILMGVGAVFAALNTMYSAVSSRTREIATLRALGFGAAPVVTSVLLESAVLGLLGGIVGGLLVYFGLNGYQATTLNFGSFSQLTFAFTVTPRLLVTGLWYSLILGVIGGLLPGIRAARMPVTTGLREL